jgi:hypothetical protein
MAIEFRLHTVCTVLNVEKTIVTRVLSIFSYPDWGINKILGSRIQNRNYLYGSGPEPFHRQTK